MTAPLSAYDQLYAEVAARRANPPARHPDVKLLHQENYIGADTLTPQRAEVSRLRDALATANEQIECLQQRIEETNALLAEWANTYPDLDDIHDAHHRGRFYVTECGACRAELKLLEVAQNAACVALSAGASGEPVQGQPSLSFPR